jgi:hypothetical protein
MHKIQGGMGFMDLSAFNLAILGKHGWKLQIEPNSLISRLFKARCFPSCNCLFKSRYFRSCNCLFKSRYFPSCNYLTAKSDHNPSYVWRNISELVSVSGGVRWCIGTCSSIPILNEMWIQNGRCIDSNMPGTFMFKKFTNNSFIYVAHKR